MRIESLLEKKEQIQMTMLKTLLLQGGSMYLEDLRKQVGLSKSGMSQYIDDFASLHTGVTVTQDGDMLMVTLVQEINVESILAKLVTESIKFQILLYLLKQPKWTTIQLATELALSESSVFRKIKELNKSLETFHIQIKNGSWHGEELQVRFFYYQLLTFLSPVYPIAGKESENFIRVLEGAIGKPFTAKSVEKIQCWLYVMKWRASVKKPMFQQLRKKMLPYLEDTMLKKIDPIVGLYSTKHPSESTMFFIFLVSCAVLDQETFYQYNLTRSKKSPALALDIHLREMIATHYRPRRLEIELEKRIGYLLGQVHHQLYFFTGRLVHQDMENIQRKLEDLLDDSHKQLLDKLVKVVLKELGEAYDKTYVTIHYTSLLSMIDFDMTKVVHIGMDIDNEPLYQLWHMELSSLVSVEIEKFQANKQYDLILTKNQIQGEGIIYRLSEFQSAYDIKQIKQLIQSIKQNA